MKLIFNEKEKEILDQIVNRFDQKYDLDWGIDGLSIFVNKKIFQVKLNINIHYVHAGILTLSINDNEKHVTNLDDNLEYLDMIQDILNNLDKQLYVYTKYIADFVKDLEENDDVDDFLVDLVEGKLYLYGKVVVGPLLDMNNDEDYCAFFINSLNGLYPMKRFTSLSYEDLKDCIMFFVN